MKKNDNDKINIKDFNRKRNLISPKAKNKEIIGNNINNNMNAGPKKNIGLNNKNINIIDNKKDIIKNLIDKNPPRKNHIIIQENKSIEQNNNKNDNILKNNNIINRNGLDNHNNILNNNYNNYKLLNNYIQNNYNSNMNIKLNNHNNTNDINDNQNKIFKYASQLNNKQKNSVLIRNKAILANNVSDNKKSTKYFC